MYLINISRCDNTLLYHIIMCCSIYYILTIMRIKLAEMMVSIVVNIVITFEFIRSMKIFKLCLM